MRLGTAVTGFLFLICGLFGGVLLTSTGTTMPQSTDSEPEARRYRG